MTLKVVTINMLSDLSRWDERRVLMVNQLADLSPDIVALQEVSLPENPAAWIAKQLGQRSSNASRYEVYLCPKSGFWGKNEGIAILSRIPADTHECILLGGQGRVAQKIRIIIENEPLYLINVHLFWQPGYSEDRQRQIRILMDWLNHLSIASPVVILGDFNATPLSETIRLIKNRYKSAFESVHGIEPEYTCPTPLSVSLKSSLTTLIRFIAYIHLRSIKLNWRGTLDYIFVNNNISVLDSQITLNNPHPTKSNLFPSDHFGLFANLKRNL